MSPGAFRPLRSIAAVVLWLVLIALATLRTADVPPQSPYPLDPYCLICGRRGSADALLNLILFVPLGFAAARRWGLGRAVAIGVIFSAAIETAQASIPGRFPTTGDIVWNGLGATAGAALAVGWRAWPRLSVAARTAVAAGITVLPLLPTALMGRAPTARPWFAQWAPLVSTGSSYQGPVREARIGEIDLPRGVPRTDTVRDALRRGTPLRISFLLAPPPQSLSQVFRFVDAGSEEIASLSVRGQDLVWSERIVASALAFETPSAVWVGALGGDSPGSTMTVVVRRERSGSVCMRLRAREHCGLLPSAGDGWQLLASLPGSRAARGIARVFWLGIPTLLAGWLAGGGVAGTALVMIVGIAAAAATALLPGVGFAPVDPTLIGAGVLAGAALAKLIPTAVPARSDRTR